ncbi:hypothetical protein HY230_07905 [Candidatus Acetothermia bacterium]|nr:hypothetical protein [Candidatus Acetothermia bacterium]
MFRKFLALVLAVVGVAGALPFVTQAAPISGTFDVDLFIAPAICSNVPFPPTGCAKVGDTIMQFEADLHFALTISGLEIGGTTVFSFKGVEFQSFTLSATIGALTVRDTFVFAPSIVEIGITKDPFDFSDTYCVNSTSHPEFASFFFSCPTPDGLLTILLDAGYQLIRARTVNFGFTEFHEAYAIIYKAQLFDILFPNMLNDPLVFRKKVVDLSLNIAGLTISTRAMFANVGTATTPSYMAGVIAAVEGQTVSGVTVRAATYIGARQGEECFAECKPDEILHGGKVISSFTIQEEKLFIRNLTIAGVIFDIKAEFLFFTAPGSACPNPGICVVEINSRGKITPLNLSIANELILGPDLNPVFDELTTNVKFGDVAVTLQWVFFPSTAGCGFGLPCPWEAQLAEILTTFDPPGVTVSDELVLCYERLFTSGGTQSSAGNCIAQNGVFRHEVYVSTKVANFTLDLEANFSGLLSKFTELDADLNWIAGNVDFEAHFVIFTDGLAVMSFGTSVKF